MNKYIINSDNDKFINTNKIINKKINFIDHIVWINLDRSINRKENMEKILLDIEIKNTRINAIDGKLDDVRNMICPIETKITDCEIACTLSHIKAINYLNNLEGDYFMVCEDDISFNNIYLIDEDLETIIKNSPEFDILLLSKIYFNKLDNKYTNWTEEKNKSNDYSTTIWSTGCYIISKKGVNKLCNKVSYENNIFEFNNSYIDVADLFLYTELSTYVYKYNFICTVNEDSTIHNDHMDYQRKSAEYQLEVIYKDFI